MTQKHWCAVPGCGAQTTRFANWICSRHWRMVCPPRSDARRVYNRFFREAKKAGCTKDDHWPPALERRFWRFWQALINRAQRIEAEGQIDKATIDKMFGWE